MRLFTLIKAMVSGFLVQLLKYQAPHSEIKVMPQKDHHVPSMIWPDIAARPSPSSFPSQLSNMPSKFK